MSYHMHHQSSVMLNTNGYHFDTTDPTQTAVLRMNAHASIAKRTNDHNPNECHLVELLPLPASKSPVAAS